MDFQFIPLKHVQWVFLHRYCIMVIMMAKAFTINIVFKIKYLKILRFRVAFTVIASVLLLRGGSLSCCSLCI